MTTIRAASTLGPPTGLGEDPRLARHLLDLEPV